MKKSPKTRTKQYVFDDKTRQNTKNQSPIDDRTWDCPMSFHELSPYDVEQHERNPWKTTLLFGLLYLLYSVHICLYICFGLQSNY